MLPLLLYNFLFVLSLITKQKIMKKSISLVLFLVPFFCHAQTARTQLAQNEEFCVVSILTAGNEFEIYVGDSTKKTNKERMIKDGKGKVIDFGSFVLALNYLEQKGWTLLTATSASANGFSPANGATFIYKRNIESKN